MDRWVDNWRVVAERHRHCDDDSRRCRDCQAYWPCTYRLRADRELSRAGSLAGASPAAA